MSEQIIFAANALPGKVRRKESGGYEVHYSAGGLVTALQGANKSEGAQFSNPPTWVGSFNKDALVKGYNFNNEDPNREPGGLEEAMRADAMRALSQETHFDVKGVFLSDEEEHHHYAEVANARLWPEFHDMLDRSNLHSRTPDQLKESWKTYREVNIKFAEQIINSSAIEDLVWVQDYHLLNVAQEMRNRGREAQNINFFLHIPFPTVETFRQLPEYQQIEMIEGLLAYDLVGFHVPEYVQNFKDCIQSLRDTNNIDVDIEDGEEEGTFVVKNRYQKNDGELAEHTARIGAFPISIDYDAFANPSNEEAIQAEVKKLLEQRGDLFTLFNCGRNDYTKGFADSLRAYMYLLQNYDSLRGKIQLSQVVVPSRVGIGIQAYDETHAEVFGLIEQVNKEFGTKKWTPVNTYATNLNRDQLIAQYRTAQLATITPKRDGMNLVAMEYAAAGPDNGVLIIGKSTGAAHALNAADTLTDRNHALLVNPTNYEDVANKIVMAIEMPDAEKRYHMQQLKLAIQKNDVHAWLNKFLTTAKAR